MNSCKYCDARTEQHLREAEEAHQSLFRTLREIYDLPENTPDEQVESIVRMEAKKREQKVKERQLWLQENLTLATA